MELTVIGSGSKGNCYILQNDQEAIMIEAGVQTKKALRALHSKKSLLACLVTHEHKDHSKYVKDVIGYGVPVYTTPGTANACKLDSPLVKTFSGFFNGAYDPVFIGNFVVRAFRTRHDACEPCGFMINHPDVGTMLFATDTNYLTHKFSLLTNIMIECNYEETRLQKRTDIPEELKERIRESHMSLDTCIGTLKANNLSFVNNIVLIHISEGDGDPEYFTEQVKKATNKTVHSAVPGLTIDFNKTPF